MTGKDYHRVLGVRKGASRNDIRKAYRRLALLYHPDRNKDAGAEERFKEINQAYAILSGKEKAPERLNETRNWRGGTGSWMPETDSWMMDVLRVWEEMEMEKTNNAYR